MKTISCPKCNEVIVTSKRKKDIEAVKPEKVNLHTLITSINDIQHMRIIFEGRHRNTGNNIYGRYVDNLVSLELFMKDHAEQQTKLYPIHEWIIAQKGLSYDIAGQLIGLIQDISKFNNVSKLWSYFGLGVMEVCQKCGLQHYESGKRAEKVVHIAGRLKEQWDKKIVKDGKEPDFMAKAHRMLCSCKEPVIKRTSQRRLKAKKTSEDDDAVVGALLDYNPVAKSVAIHKVGGQFVKQGGYYRELYDKYKLEYQNREDLMAEVALKSGKKTKGSGGEVVETKGTMHIHRMAQRRMVKMFISHLWTVWRELEGLEAPKPWIIAVGGHSDYIAPPKGEGKK